MDREMASKCGWKECEMEIVFVSYRVSVKEEIKWKYKVFRACFTKVFLSSFCVRKWKTSMLSSKNSAKDLFKKIFCSRENHFFLKKIDVWQFSFLEWFLLEMNFNVEWKHNLDCDNFDCSYQFVRDSTIFAD